MVKTPSNMLPLGTIAPPFTLLEPLADKERSLQELRGEKATVIMFICNHCPYVKHVDDQLVAIAKDYQDKGIAFIAISSNDVENYPADAPEKMAEEATRLSYPFPYLYDETQDVAKAYQAACTPDFYLFDSALACVYRGQLDDSRPNTGIPLTGKDLRSAIDAVMEGKLPHPDQTPSIGCNIKWKA